MMSLKKLILLFFASHYSVKPLVDLEDVNVAAFFASTSRVSEQDVQNARANTDLVGNNDVERQCAVTELVKR